MKCSRTGRPIKHPIEPLCVGVGVSVCDREREREFIATISLVSFPFFHFWRRRLWRHISSVLSLEDDDEVVVVVAVGGVTTLLQLTVFQTPLRLTSSEMLMDFFCSTGMFMMLPLGNWICRLWPPCDTSDSCRSPPFGACRPNDESILIPSIKMGRKNNFPNRY